jgi:hypothetical protein
MRVIPDGGRTGQRQSFMPWVVKHCCGPAFLVEMDSKPNSVGWLLSHDAFPACGGLDEQSDWLEMSGVVCLTTVVDRVMVAAVGNLVCWVRSHLCI